jgi:hypothetical protein
MHGSDVSGAPLRRHYGLVMVFEAVFVALLWLFSRTFV